MSTLSIEFRGSRVAGRRSRVVGRGSRVAGFKSRVAGSKKVAGFEKVFRRLHYRNITKNKIYALNANFRKVKFTFIYLINANLRVFIRTIS